MSAAKPRRAAARARAPHLMRTANEVNVVALQELGHDVRAKGEAHAAVVLAPAANVLVRVRPQQVAQEARVGDVRRAHDLADLLETVQVR